MARFRTAVWSNETIAEGLSWPPPPSVWSVNTVSLDLNALRVFVRVAELSSFTQAASQLGMPKARASANVQKLEAEIGARLLHRSTRLVQLTPEGELLLSRARGLLAEADELSALFQGGVGLRGRVRVELPTGVAREYVIPRVAEILSRHPQLDLHICASDRIVAAAREGLDIVMRMGLAPEPGLVGRRIGQLSMTNYASPAYLRQRGIPKRLEDLSAHFVINFASDPEPGFEYFDGAAYQVLPMRHSLTVDNIDAYLAACIAGLGIVQVPRRNNERSNQLVEVLPEYTARPMPVSILHTHGRSVPRRVRAVINWLIEVLAPLAAE